VPRRFLCTGALRLEPALPGPPSLAGSLWNAHVASAELVGDARICRKGRRQIVRKASLGSRSLRVVKRDVDGYASRLRLEAARRVKVRVRKIDSPKGSDGEVLSGSQIADNANDPAVDLTLIPGRTLLKGTCLATT